MKCRQRGAPPTSVQLLFGSKEATAEEPGRSIEGRRFAKPMLAGHQHVLDQGRVVQQKRTRRREWEFGDVLIASELGEEPNRLGAGVSELEERPAKGARGGLSL
jgi:hypothetical protein